MVDIPIVNQGLLYVNGFVLGENGTDAFLTVGPGAARDSTNTNDIVNNNLVTINGNILGANGVDVAPITNNQIYAVYVIGDSSNNNPSAAIISLALTELRPPKGYDMFRRIGWCATNSTPSPNTEFLKWYQFGAGENRTYYYDSPLPVLIGGSATSYSPVPTSSPTAPGFICPPLNTAVIIEAAYTPAAAGNTAQFRPSGSPGAIAGSAGIVRLSGVVSGVSQYSPLEIPSIIDGSTLKTTFLYRVASGDFLTLSAIGFYDDL